MKIAIGCDDAGEPLLDVIRVFLQEHQDIELLDFGSNTGEDEYYADVAEKVAVSIVSGQAERGILICGTGIGMSITANKVPGVRAALCHDTYSAERARKSNNAQVLTMGSRVIGSEHAKAIVETWLHAEFAGGGSAPKVQRLIDIENKYLHSQDHD